MSLHAWPGERECEGLTSVYRGPILLAYDHRYNLERAAGNRDKPRDYDEWSAQIDYGLNVPELDARQMVGRPVDWEDWLPPLLLLEFDAVDGKPVRLCDFGSAGMAGTPYVSWLPVRNAPQGKSVLCAKPAPKRQGVEDHSGQNVVAVNLHLHPPSSIMKTVHSSPFCSSKEVRGFAQSRSPT